MSGISAFSDHASITTFLVKITSSFDIPHHAAYDARKASDFSLVGQMAKLPVKPDSGQTLRYRRIVS
jgi:hypothetical protein